MILTQKIVEAKARIAELDLLLGNIQARRKKIYDWLSKQGQTKIDLGSDPALKREDYSKDFEVAWKMYPHRNGFGREKKIAFQKFQKLQTIKHIPFLKAIENYSKSGEVQRGYARDMVRFLKDDFWPAWVSPTEFMLTKTDQVKHDKKTREQKIQEALR